MVSRIVLTGTHSTGKKTLLDQLKGDNMLSSYMFLTEVTRDLEKRGLSINERGTDETQITIACQHYLNLLYNQSIADRCMIDCMAYTEWLFLNSKVTEETYKYVTWLFTLSLPKYTTIFYLPSEIPLVDDGVRSMSHEFRNEVEEIFEKLINTYSIPVVRLTGSVQNRTQILNNYIL